MTKQQRLEEMERQLAALKAEIEEEEKPWPQRGDEIWLCSVYGSAFKDKWKVKPGSSNYFDATLAIGNVHRTKEEAELWWKWLTSEETQASWNQYRKRILLEV